MFSGYAFFHNVLELLFLHIFRQTTLRNLLLIHKLQALSGQQPLAISTKKPPKTVADPVAWEDVPPVF